MNTAIAVVAIAVASLDCTRASRDGDDRLAVFAAASLTDAFTQVADSFRQRHPGLQVDLNFAGTPALALQLMQGATADVFASADQHWMAVVRDSGLIDGESRVFAGNRLVVIVPAANPAGINRLQDLGRKGVKLVLAGETVPAGRYARMAIENLSHAAGFTPDFAARVSAAIVSNEETVKGVVTKVALGEADAGIVYVSDVTAAVGGKVRQLEIPEAQNVRASYPIGLLRAARNPARAREFIELVLSEVGQGILRSHGFLPGSS